jgi:hypothetical protein
MTPRTILKAPPRRRVTVTFPLNLEPNPVVIMRGEIHAARRGTRCLRKIDPRVFTRGDSDPRSCRLAPRPPG